MTARARDTTGASFMRLSALVASLGLLTSRVMLLVHEFGGHAAPATFFGGRVIGWYLFLFAGGRVSYRLGSIDASRRLVVTLGGIAIELFVGALAFALARKMRERATLAFCQLCVGMMLVGHAAIYLARGVHYGFGDGAFLAQRLGESRVIVVGAASALAVTVAFAGGRRFARFAGSFFAGTHRRAVGVVLLVVACAGLVHGVASLTEVRFFSDPTWVRVMEDASVVAARDEVARRIDEARRRGEQPPDADEQARLMEALERARRPWPLNPVLLLAVGTALVAGIVRGTRERRGTEEASEDASPSATLPSWRVVGGVIAALGIVIVVILALRPLGLSLVAR